MAGTKLFGRTLEKALSLALVALATLTSVLYLQLGDTSASLSGCREALLSARRELESLRLYAQELYANCTVIREFAESLLANYTGLVEAYYALGSRYESTLRTLEEYRELYEELYGSYSELKAKYDDLARQLEVLEELAALVEALRSYHLASRVLSFDQINESLAEVFANHTSKLSWSWSTYPTPSLVNVPTPKPGYIVIYYAADHLECEFCVSISAVNSYLVPGRQMARDEYFRVEICSTSGKVEVVVPVFPYATILGFRLVSLSETCKSLLFRAEYRYFVIEKGS